jgi:protein SCO1/2
MKAAGAVRAAQRLLATITLSLAAVAGPSSANETGHPGRPIGIDLAPLFSLTTQRGDRFAKADVKGRPFIVLFGYTHCPQFCPAALADLSLHLERLGADGDRLGVVFVTIDPERDTVENLAMYLGSFDRRIIGLTGPAQSIATVAAAFGAKFERRSGQGASYSVDHSYLMFLVDRYGLLAKSIGYDEPEALASLSARLLAQ